MNEQINGLELSRIIGEPRDPRRPYSHLISTIADGETAEPNEYVYEFNVNLETDKIITTIASGVTSVNVSPLTPTLLTFTNLASPEYYARVTDLVDAKEAVLARHRLNIMRSMNTEENYQAIQLLDAAAIARGNLNDLRSGEVSYNYQHLIDQIDQIIDYSQDYVLVAGSQIDKDIKLWNWVDNKNQDTIEAFNNLGVEVVRVNQTLTRNNVAVSGGILASTVAYLVGVLTEAPGKPLTMVRKKVSNMEKLPGALIEQTANAAERWIFISQSPTVISATRELAYGLVGYQNYVLYTKNTYAISKFTRTV